MYQSVDLNVDCCLAHDPRMGSHAPGPSIRTKLRYLCLESNKHMIIDMAFTEKQG
jgi:hypothetical protein